MLRFSLRYMSCAVRRGSTFSSRKSRLSLGKTVAPESDFVKSGVVFFGGSVPYGNSRLIVMKGKSPTANQSYGAMECTVNGHYSNTTVMYKEKILHVTILDICRSVPTGVFFSFSSFVLFLISYQCKSTPMQVWKDKKSHVASFPSITDLVAQSFSGVDGSFSRRWRW